MKHFLPGEPKGWRRLQALVQREVDTQKLAILLKRLDDLLTASEQESVDRRKKADPSRTY
jgi:23S rRNA maturation mini-RNase III